MLDGFKSLAKDNRWPFALILSGVPDLAKYVVPYIQLNELLNAVYFDLIDLQTDINEINSLVYAFADTVDIDFAPLAKKDFYERLAFAGVHRWGLVIEILVEALTLCKLDNKTVISLSYFEKAFAQKSRFVRGYSPFTAEDYRQAFDEAKMLEQLMRPE